jgi:hypothetical protein
MKAFYVLTVLLLFSLNLATCSKSNLIRRLQSVDNTDSTDGYDDGNSTIPYNTRSSSGLSAGSICAIAIPCIAALVGVGAAAAILGGSAPAAGPVLVSPATNLPPPQMIDTSMAKLAVPQEIPVQPVQPQIIQPKIELPPQPVEQIIRPSYPINNIENPVINVSSQPVAQPNMVPVQQMQTVPVQSVEMVPVQQVEMVPVQEVVPTIQTANVVPQVTQIQGVQGGEFITAPEGYGTSVIQGGVKPVNVDFSSNNLM